MLELRDKVVVVTGASSGIGWHLARGLARRGARVALTARRLERLQQLEREILAAGGPPPLVVAGDVGDWAQVEALRRRVEGTWGAVDVLINNAGRGAHGQFECLDLEVARAVVSTNLLGVVYCTRAFLPQMVRRGRGHLVFISSVLGELPAAEHALYGATKFAVNGLAENLGYELEPRGIAVTLVEPGLVDTEFAQVGGRPPGRFARLPSRPAPQVAEAIIRAIQRRQRRVVPDSLGWLGICLKRHFPRAMRLFFKTAFRRAPH